MRIWILGRVLFLAMLLGIGCGSSDGPEKGASVATPAAQPGDKPASAIPSSDPKIATKAQPKLRTLKLWLGAEELTAEIAITDKEITTGMMFRTELGENEGMLFVMAVPHKASFWMKNCLFPLSCAYIDPEGTILEIHDMKPKDETPIPASSNRILYVLEVNQGWFERHKIAVGTQMKTERGTLAETFQRRQ